MSSERPLVLYHANCADGFCAAWVAHLKLGDGADYLPVQYGQPPPDVFCRTVFILDFSYKRPVMTGLTQRAKRLVCLDHHQTAAVELLNLSAGSDDGLIRFDMGKSGGRLAWEFFFPNQPSPWLVDYTEDRDLWRWKLEESREVSAGLASLPRTFDEWDSLHRDGTAVAYLAGQGAAILRYQAQLVEAHAANAAETDIDGHKVLAVNATCLMSEIGERLAQGRPFGATYFDRADGKRSWSLRSREGGIDVSEVAKRHGGGGHAAAAGYEQQLARNP